VQRCVSLAAAVALQSKIDGLIVSNTTIERPDSLKSAHKGEGGGLSGRPLLQISTNVLRDMYRLTNGKVRCGTISTTHYAELSVCRCFDWRLEAGMPCAVRKRVCFTRPVLNERSL
jgi:hypothetical protein